MMRYVGVNLEKFRWASGDVPSMRLWETFAEGRYDAKLMTAALTAIRNDFNVVRLMVGSKHLIHDRVRESYQTNLCHTLDTARELGLWVIVGVWPAGVYPEDAGLDDNETTDVCYWQYDPYFDPSGWEMHKAAMVVLAQVLGDFTDIVLYIDLRNEINGHIGSAYDEEWRAARDLYGYEWGYVPDRAATSWQQWLSVKYGNVAVLNRDWGSDYNLFADIPIFHNNSAIDDHHENRSVVKTEHRDWLVWCLRDWVASLRDIIKGVDGRLKIAQSTTHDSEHQTVPSWQLNTSSLYRQLDIGDLVDVLDYHCYGTGDHAATIGTLRKHWPDKLIVCGETHNDNDNPAVVHEAGADGVLFWSAGCSADYMYHCSHRWDTWELRPEGIQFLAYLMERKLVYPKQGIRYISARGQDNKPIAVRIEASRGAVEIEQTNFVTYDEDGLQVEAIRQAGIGPMSNVFFHLNRDGSVAIATGERPEVWPEDENAAEGLRNG